MLAVITVWSKAKRIGCYLICSGLIMLIIALIMVQLQLPEFNKSERNIAALRLEYGKASKDSNKTETATLKKTITEKFLATTSIYEIINKLNALNNHMSVKIEERKALQKYEVYTLQLTMNTRYPQLLA